MNKKIATLASLFAAGAFAVAAATPAGETGRPRTEKTAVLPLVVTYDLRHISIPRCT